MIICVKWKSQTECLKPVDGVHTISDLITQFNLLFRINDDLLLSTYCDDFRRAVGVTRVIDKPTARFIVNQVRTMNEYFGSEMLTLDCPSSSHPPPGLHQFEKDSYCRCPDARRPSRACLQLAHE